MKIRKKMMLVLSLLLNFTANTGAAQAATSAISHAKPAVQHLQNQTTT